MEVWFKVTVPDLPGATPQSRRKGCETLKELVQEALPQYRGAPVPVEVYEARAALYVAGEEQS